MDVEEFVNSLNNEQLATLLESLENENTITELYKLVEKLMDERGL